MIATVATVPPGASPLAVTGDHAASTGARLLAAGAATEHRGPGCWLAPAWGSLSSRLPGPLAEAQIPARAPPSLISIRVVTPTIFLDSIVLYVANAGGWVLRMLLRSVGQLGPTLGSFTVLYVPMLIGFGVPATPLHLP